MYMLLIVANGSIVILIHLFSQCFKEMGVWPIIDTDVCEKQIDYNQFNRKDFSQVPHALMVSILCLLNLSSLFIYVDPPIWLKALRAKIL